MEKIEKKSQLMEEITYRNETIIKSYINESQTLIGRGETVSPVLHRNQITVNLNNTRALTPIEVKLNPTAPPRPQTPNSNNIIAQAANGSSTTSASIYPQLQNHECEKVLKRDVVRCPTPPPVVKTIVERLPTPEAEVIERVFIKPKPQQIIERIIEKPKTPPPRIIERQISGEEPEPIINTRIVTVESSPRYEHQGFTSLNSTNVTNTTTSYPTNVAFQMQTVTHQSLPAHVAHSLPPINLGINNTPNVNSAFQPINTGHAHSHHHHHHSQCYPSQQRQQFCIHGNPIGGFHSHNHHHSLQAPTQQFPTIQPQQPQVQNYICYPTGGPQMMMQQQEPSKIEKISTAIKTIFQK